MERDGKESAKYHSSVRQGRNYTVSSQYALFLTRTLGNAIVASIRDRPELMNAHCRPPVFP